MARQLPSLGEEVVKEIEAAWERPQADWARQRLEAGQFWQAKDAQAWIKKRTRKTLSVSGALKVLRRLGGKLKVPRKSHAKKDPAKAAKFKVELPARLQAVAGPAPAQPVRVWVLDEHR